MNRKILAVFCFFLAAPFFVRGETTAELMDRLLAAPEISCNDASLVVFEAAELIVQGGAPFDYAKQQNWLP